MLFWHRKGKHFSKSAHTGARSKLKNLLLTSVDFCEQGANPDADITLFKSADPMEKEARTFQQVFAENRLDERFGDFQSAFSTSFRSILNDVEPGEERKTLMLQSLAGFTAEVTAFIEDLNKPPVPQSNGLPAVDVVITEKEGVIATMKVKDLNLDVSGLTPEEQTQLAALVEKAVPVAPISPDASPSTGGAVVEPTTPATPPEPAVQKTVKGQDGTEPATSELPEGVQKAAARFEAAARELEERLQALDDRELDDIAKKYGSLNDSTIRDTLGVMKKAGDQAFNSYIAALDRQLTLMEKADKTLLGEIGKTGAGGETSPVGKATAIAKTYMEADPTMTIQQAMAKAFTDHPELAEEYNSQYERR